MLDVSFCRPTGEVVGRRSRASTGRKKEDLVKVYCVFMSALAAGCATGTASENLLVGVYTGVSVVTWLTALDLITNKE
jgi:hypothetical protein